MLLLLFFQNLPHFLVDVVRYFNLRRAENQSGKFMRKHMHGIKVQLTAEAKSKIALLAIKASSWLSLISTLMM